MSAPNTGWLYANGGHQCRQSGRRRRDFELADELEEATFLAAVAVDGGAEVLFD